MDPDGDEYLLSDLRSSYEAHSQAFPETESQMESNINDVSAPAKKKREANYSQKEDKLLVSIYLYTSEDALVGTNQQIKQLWKRIHDDYKKNKEVKERTPGGLENRLGLIKAACKKFRAYLTKVENRPESGGNDLSRLQAARDMFEDLEGTKWKFDHCFDLVKDHPAWAKIDVARIPPPPNTTAYACNASSEVVNLSENVDVVHDTPLFALPRPAGKRLETKRRKKEDLKVAQNASFGKMFEAWNESDNKRKNENRLLTLESLRLQKEHVDFQKKQITRDANIKEENLKLEREKMNHESKIKLVAMKLEKDKMELEAKAKEEDRKREQARMNLEIMNKDLSSCNPIQRKWFEMQQVKLMAEMEDSTT